MTDIQVTDLTSTTSVTQGVANGTGVFDKLMNSVNLYLDDQYKSGRLKGTDYANVLLGSMQTVLAQSVQYALQIEKLLEAQIDDVRKGIELKAQQIANMVDELLTSSKQRELLDEEIESAKLQQTILETEDLLKLAQVGKTKIEADVTATMGVKDGNLKDRQLANMTIEGKVLEQKVVGRKQSQVISE
jgi:hypothetical protein